jgi:hypothetical protein
MGNSEFVKRFLDAVLFAFGCGAYLTPFVPSGRTFRPSLLVETFRVNPLSKLKIK